MLVYSQLPQQPLQPQRGRLWYVLRRPCGCPPDARIEASNPGLNQYLRRGYIIVGEKRA